MRTRGVGGALVAAAAVVVGVAGLAGPALGKKVTAPTATTATATPGAAPAATATATAVKPAPAAPTVPTGPGVITGSIGWKGEAPARTKIRRDSDPVCAKTEQLSEDIVVTGGKLAGVLVRIKNGTAGTWTPPTAPAVLTQSACAYRPRVLGIQAGQPLGVDNGDPTYHNVRGERGGKTVFNESQPDGAARILKATAGNAGDVLHLRCDVHPWMESFVPVQDHPFFAVTGTDGSFTIKGLAPGKYVLEAWHPVLGLQSTKVTIGAGKKASAKATFTFAPAKAAAAE
jgi:hypothetical protein